MKQKPKKIKPVKAWACYQPQTGEIWSAWPEKCLAENDLKKITKERLIPVLITPILPKHKPKKK